MKKIIAAVALVALASCHSNLTIHRNDGENNGHSPVVRPTPQIGGCPDCNPPYHPLPRDHPRWGERR